MREGARLAAVMDVLAELATTRQSADEVLQAWLRQRRYIGSTDRRRITALFYSVLRHHVRLSWHCDAAGLAATPRLLVLAALRLVEGKELAEIATLYDGSGYGPLPLDAAEQQALASWQTLHPPAMPEAVRVECPPALVPSLQRQFGAGFAAELAALTTTAPTDLRVNSARTTVAEVLALLTAEGLNPSGLHTLPNGVRLPPQSGNLRGLKAFADGWFEPQDASSQLAVAAMVAWVMAQTSGAVRVLDYCAGAGGKTLALAAALGTQGQILAWDSDPVRLRRLPARLARAGATEIVALLNDPAPYRGQCDAVLVDAPCTGTGTWRRHPEARGRYDMADVATFSDLQRRILAAAAPFVRPGGVLVYCTCSLLPEEDQEQAAWFTAMHPGFSPLPLPDFLPADGLLSPHRTDSDGFFIAAWQRQAGAGK